MMSYERTHRYRVLQTINDRYDILFERYGYGSTFSGRHSERSYAIFDLKQRTLVTGASDRPRTFRDRATVIAAAQKLEV